MVVVAERQEIRPVAADQADLARDQIELVEVERHIEDLVLEGIHERASSTMADLALEEVRSHAARSCASAAWRPTGDNSSATSKPDRQPSSWKP